MTTNCEHTKNQIRCLTCGWEKTTKMTLPPLQRYDVTDTIDTDVWGNVVLRKRQYGAWCLYKNQRARQLALAQRLKEIQSLTCEDVYDSNVTRRKLINELIAELEQSEEK